MTYFKEWNFPNKVYVAVPQQEMEESGGFDELPREKCKLALSKEELKELHNSGYKEHGVFIREDVMDDKIEQEREEAYEEGWENGGFRSEEELEEHEKNIREAIIHGDEGMDDRLPRNVRILRADDLSEELKLDKIQEIFKKMSDKEVDEMYDKIKGR